jgi:hypothetical protein
MAKTSKKLPKSFPTASKKMSAGPIEDLGLQNKIAANRTSSKKLVKGSPPTPPPIPPQPFPPKVGARVPV